jgi:DNA-cytosine methyltransferase
MYAGMIFGSVCSGIEAASVAWHPLGWSTEFVSEIDKFPSAVLAHHYPEVPNYGDMTKFKGWPDATIDVLVGGTPCQSFSVAGLRKGLDDPRGNLTLTFLSIADKYKPEWIVWENVPGIISDSTGALRSFLDGLEELGYIIDCDILDAQFHGVPQRRRRVFVCGQRREHLLNARTDSSALTIAQCWQEILHGILVEAFRVSGSAPENSDSASLSKDGVMRRMRLFGLLGENNSFNLLRDNLAAAIRRYRVGQSSSAAYLGANAKERTQGDPLTGSKTEGPSIPTEQQLSAALEESYAAMKSFTTSTATNSITPAQIYSCSKAVLLIAKLTLILSRSSPCFWSAASSSLTALEEFTEYARSTSSDLFGDVERVQAWRDFVGEAEHTNDALAGIGIDSFGEILPLAHSLQGHPPPSREKREGIAAATAPSLRGSGPGAARVADSRGQDCVIAAPEIARCDATREGTSQDWETTTMVAQRTVAGCLNSAGGHAVPGNSIQDVDQGYLQVVHSLRTDGFDASEDGTGRGTPLTVAHAMNLRGRKGGAMPELDDIASLRAASGGSSRSYIAFSAKDHGADAGPLSPTLRAGGHTGSHANAGVMPAVALGLQTDVTPKASEDISFTLKLPSKSGGGQPAACMTPTMQVRRLTPRECERLQGFPDDYTLIPYRGKLASDGPRYKALGNSMAVPVMRWIGERIAMVSGKLQ